MATQRAFDLEQSLRCSSPYPHHLAEDRANETALAFEPYWDAHSLGLLRRPRRPHQTLPLRKEEPPPRAASDKTEIVHPRSKDALRPTNPQQTIRPLLDPSALAGDFLRQSSTPPPGSELRKRLANLPYPLARLSRPEGISWLQGAVQRRERPEL